MPKLSVVVASTRPERVGEKIAKWFLARAEAHGRFDVERVDLRDLNLPPMDEPRHPRLRLYEHDHTRRWSALVDASEAFVFVTPEYNHGAPPALLNALDYLFFEWHYKPAGFVSYGGVSGGTRSAQMIKTVLTALKVVPLLESVTIPYVTQSLDESGDFAGGEVHDKAAALMLAELARWADALRALRS